MQESSDNSASDTAANSSAPLSASQSSSNRKGFKSCLFLLIVMTTCCGLPWGAYKLVVSKLGKMDATLTNALTKASQEHNAEENARRAQALKEIVDNAALANATALRRLATAVYEDEMLLVADSVKSFHDAAQPDSSHNVRLVIRKDDSRETTRWTDAGDDTPKKKDARKQVTIGCLLRATNLYVKYGRQRQLGDLDITLQTRAYVDERNLQWFPLFRFRVPADQLDEFIKKTEGKSALGLTTVNLDGIWIVEEDHFDRFRFKTKFR